MRKSALSGKRIVIAGSQKTQEMSMIIEKQGGLPRVRSLQGLTVFNENFIAEPLRKLAAEGADWVIMTTGLGAERMVQSSEALGFREALLASLSQAQIATRGYKTTAFLKKYGLQAAVNDEDGTVESLMKNLGTIDFRGARVWVQLHGEEAPELERFLQDKGALCVHTVLPYRHTPPEWSTLELLLSELEYGVVDAVCFTTAVQVRYLFSYALEQGRLEQLVDAFERKVFAVAVGKVTASALKEFGVQRIIVPEKERMGAMVIELLHFYESLGLKGS
ncbi:uroporphyrinogen-III synthase [Paenibacillus paridis]|uniref:uroporphyrinogen-III synthase n=1 Tax=Paenibacillus paridis TaxID=2583376 RepID=UPI00111D1547|nr:uroporphyrinogen-III synthase [Paenibacillus paridis]